MWIEVIFYSEFHDFHRFFPFCFLKVIWYEHQENISRKIQYGCCLNVLVLPWLGMIIIVCVCAHYHTNTLLHPQCSSPAHAIVGWGAGTLSPSSGCDTRSVGRGSSLRNRQSSNHLHAITLRPPLSTPPPRFICVAPAGLTAEQFLGGAGGKYISLIKDIWWLFYMLSAHC